MFRLSTLALLSLASTAWTSFAQEKITSSEGKFTITFPAKPAASTKDVETAAGKLTMFITALEEKSGLGLLVIYNDYPDSVVKGKTTQMLLENVRDGSKGPDGKIVEDKPITLGADKVAGRAYILDKGEHFARVRAFVKDARLYQVMIIGKTKEAVSSKEADTFFNSFEISK